MLGFVNSMRKTDEIYSTICLMQEQNILTIVITT